MLGSCVVFILSILAFAVSSRGLFSALQENVALTALTTGYSRQAVRIGKAYKLFAWGALTLFLFAMMIGSLIEVIRL